MILNKVPEAKVDGKEGRRSSYEVTVNGKLIFSKLSNKTFPIYTQVDKI